MRSALLLIACLLLSSCDLDAKRENMALASENDELKVQLNLSTEYIEDVTAIIDQVQRNLQLIEDREGIIDRISLPVEGRKSNAVNVRRQLMTSISDIDAYILDSRKQMELLMQRIQESQIRISSLEQLVANLDVAVKQKEKDAARLKRHIRKLEENVASLQTKLEEKDKEIADTKKTVELQLQKIEAREAVIRQHEIAEATAYYVVDTRDALKEKGLIVEKRSGFLGLGKNTRIGIMSESLFQPVQKSETEIRFEPGVHDIEIVSAQKDRPDLYEFERSDHGSQLNINNTRDFWALSEYLVIIASD